jgi:putative heme iron utilization protein
MSMPLEPALPESDEEREARAAAERKDPAAAARRLLRAERQGALATLSLHKKGWPFGSIAPYALSAQGEPILLLSALAQHTRNALADSRASLLVQDSAGLAPGADAQAHARVTLLGRLAAVAEVDEDDVRARYLARHPHATRTARGHDFRWYALSSEEARFIGGFGEICWVAGSSMIIDPSTDPLRPHRDGICEHMNVDHADALALFCQRMGGFSGEAAKMVGVDAFGFDVLQGAAGARERVRFDFAQPLSTPDEVRRAMIGLVKTAKAQRG